MIDFKRYGGRRAYLHHLATRALWFAGTYRQLTQIDWRAIDRLVFVCKGNICRSPYGAERARLLGVDAVSFGLEATDGTDADPAAYRNARQRQVDLSAHRARRLEESRLRRGDLLLVFEPRQVSAVRERCGDAAVVSLAGLWSRPARPYICDPYGRNDLCFQECYAVIDTGVTLLASQLLAAKNGSAVAL
jgi:protein-tyrosine phosphatase